MPKLSPIRWEPFIARLEEASGQGRADHIGRNMERLERVIAELMEYRENLVKLEYRARTVRERHEPPAGRPR